MVHKGALEPKNAKAHSHYHAKNEDEDEMDESTTSAVTGTLALAHFFNTTGPEEFQRPQRSPNTFFRRRKNKKGPSPTASNSTSTNDRPPPLSSSSSPTPTSTLSAASRRYIEIIPKSDFKQEPSVQSAAHNEMVPSIATNPILPSNAKQRESSLYSVSQLSTISSGSHKKSIKRQNTVGSSMTRRSTRSTVTTASQYFPQLAAHDFSLAEEDTPEENQKATEFLMSRFDGVDTIEAALRQRLERLQVLQYEKPSQVVAAGLATEHLRALQASALDQNEATKKKVRHVQVQTSPVKEIDVSEVRIDHVSNSADDSLERQLVEEKWQSKRLEAALDTSCDHFEVLAGLAYKKLRELWEEKSRWENSYMELRQQLMELQQQQQQQQQQGQEEHQQEQE
ncbi:hypothetical protein EC973_006577 [Apophysomyces ossiformis]|uniref:Uncharacterized protein n=1 Tax=Apophysomyces ossiformis TaxID=679940 RepID=A0A8H7BT75_9FUNG|nr:hypothetical protein EC973_006577 [Apophysomyces ossiformis]